MSAAVTVLVAARARNIDTSARTGADGLGEFAGGIVALPAAAVGYAILGAALGAL